MIIYKIDPSEFNRCYDPRNIALRKRLGHIYFFDDNFIWTKVPEKTAIDMGIRNIKKWESRVHNDYDLYGNLFIDPQITNLKVARKIINSLIPGDHITRLLTLAEEVRVEQRTHEERLEKERGKTPVERFILTIRKPQIYREYGNNNRKTFDFVEVLVFIRSDFPDKVGFFKAHHKEICDMIVEKIEKDKGFQRYGVPISFLELKTLSLSKSDFIRYLFELKDIICEN